MTDGARALVSSMRATRLSRPLVQSGGRRRPARSSSAARIGSGLAERSAVLRIERDEPEPRQIEARSRPIRARSRRARQDSDGAFRPRQSDPARQGIVIARGLAARGSPPAVVQPQEKCDAMIMPARCGGADAGRRLQDRKGGYPAHIGCPARSRRRPPRRLAADARIDRGEQGAAAGAVGEMARQM